jgi:hypothetical protein
LPEDAPPPAPKLIRFPALTASVLAAITTAVLGSFLGAAGTLAGAGLASAVGGVATALYERGIERAAAKARTKRTGRTVSPQARARIRKMATRKAVIRSIAGAAGIAVVTLGVITAAEYAAGRPVSAIVQGKHGTGLSVTGGGSVPQPSAPPATPTGVVPSATPVSSLPVTAPTGPVMSPTPASTALTPPSSPTATPPVPAGIPSDSATPIPPVSPGETPPP